MRFKSLIQLQQINIPNQNSNQKRKLYFLNKKSNKFSCMSQIGLGSMSTSQINIPCEVCGKQSNFTCYNCQKANYCSKQHQKQHWKNGHKNQCIQKDNIMSQRKLQIEKQLLEARKNFYENYSSKIFNHCLLDAKLMTGLSKELTEMYPQNIQYKLQYGASVCLLVKTQKILNDMAAAKHEMQCYLKRFKNFLYDMENYKELLDSKHTLKDQEKEEFQGKLNLLSGIANLCYLIGMNTTEYYVLYTKYIIACFGEQSFEASNCYFCLGTFFSEQGWFHKAIACFQKAAKIRGPFAGDCMLNIGVLHKMMNNLPKALQTLEVSIKLRQQQYGQDSNEVAQVNQLMGSIYVELNDFKTALLEYEKAFRVRCTNPITPEYENILDLIHELYDKLCLYIKIGQPNMKRPEIYTHLKQQIEGETAYWQNEKYQKFKKGDEEGQQKEEKDTLQKFKKKKVTKIQDIKQQFSWKESGLFNITQQFVAGLNLSQLFRLSQLQLQLESSDSIFNLVYIVGTSVFFQSLRPQKKVQLQKGNERLFQLMRMEDIKKIKHKDK